MKKFFNKIYKYLRFYLRYLYYLSELQSLQDEFIVNPYIENKKIRSVIIKAIYHKDLYKSIKRVLKNNGKFEAWFNEKRLRDYYGK